MPFLTRLKTSLYRTHYRYFSSQKYRVAKCKGAEFVLWPGNYVDRRIWVEGIYEPEQIQAMLALAAEYKPDMFLDVGANIGLYSCIIGKNTSIPVIASFECDPRNITMFNAHVSMNGLQDRVTLHEVAVGEKDGTIDLYMASATSTGKSSVVAPSTKEHSVRTVPMKPIDTVVTAKDKTILIKIDIEGYELPALKGMKNLLMNNKCYLQIEILPDSNGEETKEFLYESGYVLTRSIGNDHYFRKQ